MENFSLEFDVGNFFELSERRRRNGEGCGGVGKEGVDGGAVWNGMECE